MITRLTSIVVAGLAALVLTMEQIAFSLAQGPGRSDHEGTDPDL